MKREFSFDLINKEIPYEVIKKKIYQISFLTQGYVTCEISEYIGKIRSYEELTTLGLIGSSNFKLNNPVRHVDIQEELGEIKIENHKYEIYLTVKGLENYKYRICFIEYGSISYPVSLILDSDIAFDCMDQSKEEYTIENQVELEEKMDSILNSDRLGVIIQNLIYEAIRREQQ